MCEAAKGELFDARIERLRKTSADGEGQKSPYVDAAQLARLELMEKREQKHYKEELRVAELTQAELPEKPEGHIFRLNLEELGELVRAMEAQPSQPRLDGELIKRTKEKMEEEIEREEAERARQEEKRINVHTFLLPEEAIAYAKLKKIGFPDPQIKCILRLVQEGIQSDPDELLKSFDAQMDLETVELLVQFMLS